MIFFPRNRHALGKQKITEKRKNKLRATNMAVTVRATLVQRRQN